MSNPIALIGRAGTYLLLSLAAFLSIFPFFWMVVGASNTSADIIRGKGMPGGALWDNIVKFVNSFDMVRVLFNSFLLAGLGTVLTLLVASMAGYGFEMFCLRFHEKVFGGLLLMLSILFAALMIPLFILMAQFKIINTYRAVLLPSIASIFIIFYFRQATKAFLSELRDAAKIDGLKEWQIFLYVYMPVMRSTYAAATIIVFMANWNSYLWPLIVLQTNEMKTLTPAVATLAAGYTPDFGVIMVGAIAATLPTLVIFFLLQRRFVEGMLGAVK
ncbi:carbohydrate ABC transporter permease [Devosia sp. A8/3-2]|nr:carbohydrate ABC transporter permease [Devosia sp. A8/3-2]